MKHHSYTHATSWYWPMLSHGTASSPMFILEDGSLMSPATKVCSAVLSRQEAGPFLLGSAASEGES